MQSAAALSLNPSLNNIEQKKTIQKPSAKLKKATLFSSVTHLPVLENSGHVVLPSNATNFHGGNNASVDPRTGTVSFYMTVGDFLYEHANLSFALRVAYLAHASPSQHDIFGLGSEWTWNIGTEKQSTTDIQGVQTTDISTGDGHAFTMVHVPDKKGRMVWKPLRHKLHDVLIAGKPGDWTITAASGKIVHLHNGFEDWLQTADGSRIWFYYDHNFPEKDHQHLIYVCSHPMATGQLQRSDACSEGGIHITYANDQVVVHGKQVVRINLSSNSVQHHNIQKIVMPSLSSLSAKTLTTILIAYDNQNNKPWLLKKLSYSTGLTTTFFYNGESPQSHLKNGLSTGFAGGYLPVVTSEVTHSINPAIADRKLSFSYRLNDSDQHNYTGYQSNQITMPGKDNLMDRSDNYVYHVTVDNGMTQTTTTYNKYHLPLQVKQINKRTLATIATHVIQYAPWKNTTFNQLPPDYSMPRKTLKTLYDLDSKHAINLKPTLTTEQKRYDASGRIIWKQDMLGRQTFIQYCPVVGDKHCAPLRSDLPTGATLPEKVIQMPALNDSKDEEAPDATEIMFDYTTISSSGTSFAYQYKTDSQTHYLVQIRRKTTATLNPKTLLYLKVGDSLPDIQRKDIVTETSYQYNHHVTDPDFGQLNQVTITKPNKTTHFSKNNLLALPEMPSQTLSYRLTRMYDPARNTITVYKFLNTKNRLQKERLYHTKSTPLDTSKSTLLDISTYSETTGKLLQQESPHQKLNITWLYDQWNRPIQKTISLKHNGHPKITRWQYALNSGNIAAIKTTPEGYQTKIISAPSGQVISSWHRISSHKKTNAWILDASVAYMSTGQVGSVTHWMANDQGKPMSLTTFFGYDALNRPVWKKTPDGRVLLTVYDDVHLRVFHYQMITDQNNLLKFVPLLEMTTSNLLGKPVDTYLFSLNFNEKKHGNALYSQNMIQRLQRFKNNLKPSTALRVIDSDGLVTINGRYGLSALAQALLQKKAWLSHSHFVYDKLGRLIRKTYGHGSSIRYIWQHGNLIATITPKGNLIHNTYDLAGHVIQRCIQAKQSHYCHILGTRHYNDLGLLVWQKDVYGHTTYYRYDQEHRLTDIQTPKSTENSNGHHFSWCYSDMGVTQMSVDGSAYILYRYDPISWRLTDQEDRVSHWHYTYQKETGLLTHTQQTAPNILKPYSGIDYPQGQIWFYYDQYHHPTHYIDRYGNLFTSKHDYLGRVVQTQVKIANNHHSTLLLQFTYDALGRIQTENNGIGVTRSFVYDALGEVLSIKDTRNHNIVQALAYTYDTETGNIASFTQQLQGFTATQTYHYDKTNNLTHMSCFDTKHPKQTSLLCPRETGLANSHLNKPPIIQSQSYRFDAWNNMEEVTEQVVTEDHQSLTKTMRYIYDGNQASTQPKLFDPWKLEAIDTHWSNQSFTSKPQQLKWDSLGRIIKDLDGNTLHYNALGQMDSFIRQHDGAHIDFMYDGFGRQVVEKVNDTKQQVKQHPLYMIYDGTKISSTQQKSRDGRMHYHIDLHGVASLDDHNIDHWQLQDHKGDVLISLNNSGNIVSANVYSPYGMQYQFIHPAKHSMDLLWQQNRNGFDGQISDKATGYQFLGGGYRAYNPSYRRFMSHDSFSPFIKVDGYGFADNNPIMNTDPTGHMSKGLNYAVSAFGMGMSAGLAFLMPVSAWAASLSVASLALSIAGGIAMGAVGVVSGGLQIATTATHHASRALKISNAAFGLANSVIGFAAGAVSAAEGGVLFASQTSNLGKIASGLVITSGVTGSISGGLGVAQSAMDSATIDKPNLANRSGFKTALKVLGITSMVTMGVSMISGIATGVFGAIAKVNNRPEPVETNQIEKNYGLNMHQQNFLRSMFVDLDIDTLERISMEDAQNPFVINDAYHDRVQIRGSGFYELRVDLTSVQGLLFRKNMSTNTWEFFLNSVQRSVNEIKLIIIFKSREVRALLNEQNVFLSWRGPEKAYRIPFKQNSEYNPSNHQFASLADAIWYQKIGAMSAVREVTQLFNEGIFHRN